MYTEADFESVKKTTTLRLILFILLASAFLAAMIVFNIMRVQVASIASAAVGFCVCYFVFDFKILPWVKYNRFMRELKHGSRRKSESEFVMVSDETRVHDGVDVYEFITRIGLEEKDTRLYFWDADKTLPHFNEGDKLEIMSFSNFITDIKVI